MLSPRPLVSSALALLGLVTTLGFAGQAGATPSMTISTKQTVGADLLLDELTIEAGGTLEVVPLRTKGGTGAIHIRARKITVKQLGTITATRAGYLGVNGADGGAAPGSTGGGKRGGAAGHPGGGGGYLGVGASGADDMCVPYADSTGGDPVAMPPGMPVLGSAGGAANGTGMAGAGGDGGGVILLDAAEIVIDGTIEAKGGSAPMLASGVAPGGGSGGLIAITAVHVTGSGVISVAGGSGLAAPGAGAIKANNGGGGAGGVVLIKARDVSQMIQDKIEIKGGSTGGCPAALDAAAGSKNIDVSDAAFCVDVDGDGAFSTACDGKDCDDSDEAIHPGAAEVCNATDDDCDGVNNEGDDLCPAGRTCDATAKMCIDISDGGSDAGPAVDPGAPPDHIAFESGCALGGGSPGPGVIVLAALGLGALVTRRRRASRREKACR